MANIVQNWLLKIGIVGDKKVLQTSEQIKASMRGTQQAARGAAAGYNEAGDAAARHHMKSKGVAGATANQTKAFAKMERGMTGGLVPAYATVAANIFALTAAFGALSRAGDFQVLIAGAESLSVQTGRNLIYLADSMQDVTDNAITMKEALTSASIAASAGFDNKTILELTEVARNASIALGRDMTDAMNRVFKGAVKAEPELLDELGIILRLDPATRKYAASLGKAVSELTTFEKQQAVVNEVIAQGQEKFSELSKVDVNPFTQLSAAFLEATNTIIGFINVGLGPFITLLTDNMYTLISAMAIFGNTVLKSAIPALQKLSGEVSAGLTSAFQDLANEMESKDISIGYFDEMKDGLTDFDSVFDETARNLENSFDNFGENLPKDLFAGIQKDMDNKLVQPSQRVDNALKKVNKSLSELDPKSDMFEEQRFALNDMKGALVAHHLGLLKISGSTEELAKQTDLTTNAYKRFTNGLKLQKLALVNGFLAGTSGGFKNLRENIREYSASIKYAEGKGVAFNFVLKQTSVLLYGVSAAMGALVRLIPIIGQIVFVFGLLKSGADKLLSVFRENNDEILALDKAYEDHVATLETTLETSVNYEANLKKLPKTIDNVTKQLTAQSNVLNTLGSELQNLINLQNNSGDFGWWDNILDFFGQGKIDDLKDIIIPKNLNILENLDIEGSKEDLQELREEFEKIGGSNATGEAAYVFLTRLQVVIDKYADLKTEAKDAHEILTEGLIALEKSINTISTGKLTDVETVFIHLSTVLNSLEGADIRTVASSLAEMSSVQAFSFNIEEEVRLLTYYGEQADIATKMLADMDKQTKALEAEQRKLSKTYKTAFEKERLIEVEATMANIAEETKNVEAWMSLVNEQLDIYTKSALITLDEQLEYYRELIKVQKVYNAQLAQINFLKSIPGSTTRDRIDLINRQMRAETRLNNLTRAADEDKQKRLEAEIAALDRIDLMSREKGNRELTAGEDKRRTAAKTTLLQIEQKLAATQTKNVKAYTAQLNGLKDVLKDLAKERALGFTLDIEPGELADEIIPVIHRIGNELGILDEDIQKAIGSFRSLAEEEAFSVKTGGATPTKVATDIIGLEDKIRAFEIESDYLRRNAGLIEDRIDKEFILAEAVAERILMETEASLASGNLGVAATNEKLELERQLYDFLERNSEAAKAFVASQLEQESKRGEIIIANRNAELKAGLKLNAVEKANLELATKKEILNQQNIDKSTAAYKRRLKVMERIAELDIKFDLKSDVKDALEPFREFSDILEEMRDRMDALSEPADKMAAAFTAAFKAGEEADNNVVKAIGQAGLAITQFQEDFKNAGFDIDAIYKSWTDLAQGFGGAMSQAFEEGSAAANAFKAVQIAGAIVDGVRNIIASGAGIPFPGNLAAMAATAATVIAQLSSIGASGVSSVSSSGAGPSEAEEYQASFGENRITGGDAQTNALGDSLDSLTIINKALFGSQKDLRRSIYALKKSFDTVGAALFNQGGTFSAGDITANFGAEFGTTKGGNWLFGVETTTTELLAAGLQLGTTIEYVAGEFKGSMDKAIFITKQVTETDSGFLGFGGGTDVDIKTQFKGLDERLSQSLDDALNNTFDTIVGLVENWGGGLENYFNEDFTINLPKEQLNLVGLSATEQADVVSAYFSRVGNKILADQLPWLKNWVRAGEELLDTLIRLTNSTLVLNEAFSAGGTSVDELAQLSVAPNEKKYDKYVSKREEVIAFWEEQEQDALHIIDVVNSFGGNRNRVPEIARLIVQWDDDISTFAQAMTHLDNITDGHIGGGVSSGEYNSIINYYQNEAKQAGMNADKVVIKEMEAWHQQRVDNARAAWITALEDAYGGTIEDFSTAYNRFLEAVFDPEELAKIQVGNAENVINAGFVELESLTENRPWVGGLIESIKDSEDPAKRLGEVYTELAEKGFFAGEAGAVLLESLVALGNGYADLEDATEEATTAIDTFLRDILRRIEQFGKEGKELELLNLEFEFEDLMSEAVTKGMEEVVAVETLYGLERLKVVSDYNAEIVESLKDSLNIINDGVLTIIGTSKAWNDISYQSLKIDNIRNRLYKSFVTGDFEGNTEALTEAIGFLSTIDTSGTEDFTEALGEYINFSEEVPGSIQEQIDLANELTQAIMDRYNAEVAYVEELKQLSIDIKGYLDDLAVSDLSPLTNMQMFEELSARFAQDLEDLASGDVEVASAAGDRLLSDADALLQLGSDLYAIGPQYQELFEYVTSSLQSVDAALDDKIVSETDILNELQETTLDELEAVKGVLGILEERQNEIYLGEIREILYSLKVPITEIAEVLKTNMPLLLEEIKQVPWPVQPQDLPELKVPGAATGTPMVPFDQLAMIHQGEMIIPAESAQMLREGTGMIGGGIDTSAIVNSIGVLTQIMAESQEELINQGERQINTSQEIADSQRTASPSGTVGIL